MPGPPDRFQMLANQFDLVVDMLNECGDPKERVHLLRHMKAILNQLDDLTTANLKRDSQDITSSPPPDERAAES